MSVAPPLGTATPAAPCYLMLCCHTSLRVLHQGFTDVRASFCTTTLAHGNRNDKLFTTVFQTGLFKQGFSNRKVNFFNRIRASA